jgi:hypothetical protein
MVKDSTKYASTDGWGSLNLTTANLQARRKTPAFLPRDRQSRLRLQPLLTLIAHAGAQATLDLAMCARSAIQGDAAMDHFERAHRLSKR